MKLQNLTFILLTFTFAYVSSSQDFMNQKPVVIMFRHNKKCLEVKDSSTEESINIILTECTGDLNQQFNVFPFSLHNDYFEISSINLKIAEESIKDHNIEAKKSFNQPKSFRDANKLDHALTIDSLSDPNEKGQERKESIYYSEARLERATENCLKFFNNLNTTQINVTTENNINNVQTIRALLDIEKQNFSYNFQLMAGIKDFYIQRMEEETKLNSINTSLFLDLDKPNLIKDCMTVDFFLENQSDFDLAVNKNELPDFYFSLLRSYFKLEEVIRFLLLLNENNNLISSVSIKEPASILQKVFLRTKKLNDIVRATIASESLEFIFPKLTEWLRNSEFDYWIEENQSFATINFSVLKMYIYHKTRRYKDKICPVEVQFMTTKAYFYEMLSQQHLFYELARLKDFEKSANYYSSIGLNIDDIARRIGVTDLKNSLDLLENKGSFRESGRCVNEGFLIKQREDEIHFSNILDSNAIKKTSVILGHIYLENTAFWWTSQAFDVSDFEVRFDLKLSGSKNDMFLFDFGPQVRTAYYKQQGFTIGMIKGIYFIVPKHDTRNTYSVFMIEKEETSIKISLKDGEVSFEFGESGSTRPKYLWDTVGFRLRQCSDDVMIHIKNLSIRGDKKTTPSQKIGQEDWVNSSMEKPDLKYHNPSTISSSSKHLILSFLKINNLSKERIGQTILIPSSDQTTIHSLESSPIDANSQIRQLSNRASLSFSSAQQRHDHRLILLKKLTAKYKNTRNQIQKTLKDK